MGVYQSVPTCQNCSRLELFFISAAMFLRQPLMRLLRVLPGGGDLSSQLNLKSAKSVGCS